ncbi:hypothetical protein J2Z40_002803 [Cytobacillus eiseniae]|uniref:TcaA protein NTF2-like domain-containing protein n=1 Tax=Cytobacillus eiseniae TaxID=762947 RepID=A0ABS4RH53_9BACI|nr:DUF5050 domain-containing protein [Cytobacillus eiseniae]MBP2242229.1 hypothetical protein [Cytobacillus eiseniae]
MKKGKFAILIFIMALLLTACSGGSEEAGSKKKLSEMAKNTFLLYSEAYENEDGLSIGDLYIKTIGKEEEKIASSVVNGQFEFVIDTEKVLYIDEEDELYEVASGQDKEKIASNVSYFNANHTNNIITYQNEESDLYVVNKERESEKIASEIAQYEVIDNNIYYLGYDGDFHKYNLETREELSIANDVANFTLLNAKELVYANDDYMLFYKNNDDPNVKISSKEVSSSFIQKVDNQLMYFAEEDGHFNLYTSSLDGSTTDKIASEVTSVELDGKNIYYLTTDGNVFVKKATEEKAKKLLSDVTDFTLNDDTVYYTDEESNFYKLADGGKKEKVAADVESMKITDKGEFIYQNSNDELYLSKTKLSSDIDEFSFVSNNLAYATLDDKLYFMTLGEEKQVVSEDLSKYSIVTYHNKIIYSNYLSFDDVSGTYSIQDGDETYYAELNNKGIFTSGLSNETLVLDFVYAGFNYINVKIDEEYATLRLDGNQLILEDEYEQLIFTKSSKEEMNKEVANQKALQEKQEAEAAAAAIAEEINYVLSDYLYEYTAAVNYDDISSLHYYILDSSTFYKEQTSYAQSLTENGTYLDLLDYTIGTPVKVTDDTYNVEVMESFDITKADGTSSETTYTSIYTLKYVNDEWFITDMKISSK